MGSENGRLMSVDVAKGFAIIVVVLVHLLVLVPHTVSGPSASVVPVGSVVSIPLEILYSGLMLFFVYCGYFHKPGRGIRENVRRRVVQLLGSYIICIVVLTSVFAFYLLAIGYDVSLSNLPADIFELILSYNLIGGSSDMVGVIVNGFYFLIVIFLGLLVFYLMERKALENIRNMILAVVCLVTASAILVGLMQFNPPFHLKVVPMAAAFMLVGAFARKYDALRWLEENVRNRKFWGIMLGSLLIASILAYLFPTTMGFNASVFGTHGGWSAFSFFAIGVSGSTFMFCAMCLLMRVPVVSKVLAFVGLYTMEILILHTFYAKVIIAPFYTLPHNAYFPSMPLDVTLLVALLAIVLSIVTAMIVRIVIARMREKHSKA